MSTDFLPGATHLECTATGERFESERLQGLSPAGKPFFARYDLAALRGLFTPQAVAPRRADLWRYEEILPVRNREMQVCLGRGGRRSWMRRVWRTVSGSPAPG